MKIRLLISCFIIIINVSFAQTEKFIQFYRCMDESVSIFSKNGQKINSYIKQQVLLQYWIDENEDEIKLIYTSRYGKINEKYVITKKKILKDGAKMYQYFNKSQEYVLTIWPYKLETSYSTKNENIFLQSNINFQNRLKVEYGTVNADNVSLRKSNDIKSNKLKSLNKNDKVIIIKKSKEEGSLVYELNTGVNLSISDTTIVNLNKGQIMKIIKKYNDDSVLMKVNYNGKSYEGRIPSKYISKIRSTWYEVETKDNQIGWVYSKFIKKIN